jgi:hypothetical protein
MSSRAKCPGQDTSVCLPGATEGRRPPPNSLIAARFRLVAARTPTDGKLSSRAQGFAVKRSLWGDGASIGRRGSLGELSLARSDACAAGREPAMARSVRTRHQTRPQGLWADERRAYESLDGFWLRASSSLLALAVACVCHEPRDSKRCRSQRCRRPAHRERQADRLD